MCVVSAVSDNFSVTFPQKHPGWTIPVTLPQMPSIPDYRQYIYTPVVPEGVTRQEFDALKNEIQELKTLLLAAKKYDEATGQPDCEVEDKVALIKKIASLVDVNMDEVFK